MADRNHDGKLKSLTYKYRRARLAYACGKTDEAKALFEEVIADAPDFGYARLAKRELEHIENGIDYNSIFETVTPKDNAASKIQNAKKLAKIKTAAVIIGAIAYLAVTVFVWQKQADNTNATPYTEEIRLLVEESYNGVKVLDVFTVEKDQKQIDSMFFCETSDAFLVGSVYSYTSDKSDQKHVQVSLKFSPFSFKDGSSKDCANFEVPCINYDYCANIAIYKNKDDIPTDCMHSFEFVMKGKTVYFALLGVSENKIAHAMQGIFEAVN